MSGVLMSPVREFVNSFDWPDGFSRIPDEEWTRSPLDTFGLRYDSVGSHGWYQNLEPTVAQVLAGLERDQILVDYSAGTGILTGRLLPRLDHPVGIVNVDSSPKFLRVALENHRDDERVAFRLLDYVRQERRLRLIDEVLEPSLVERGVDMLTSTNAIHLYYNLRETFDSWRRVLRSGALVLVCSGNIRNPYARPGEWIIDETVAKVNEIAADVVATDPAFEEYRPALEDSTRMDRHRRMREKVFVPVRPLDYYIDTFRDAGFRLTHRFETTVHSRVDEWHQLLCTYSDGVLGWVGGSQKVEGAPPSATALRNRHFLIRYCLERLFPGQASFPCCWTYLTVRN